MKIFIYSLKETLFQGEAISLNCTTLDGEITILDNHEPLITVLKNGVMKIVDKENNLKRIQIENGFLETRSNNEVRCIVGKGEAEL